MPVPEPMRLFLLSPAHTGGKRASFVFNDAATFELARKIRTPRGATIGETFAFLSGLYFRGKLAYAQAFAASPAYVLVITTDRGLVRADARIGIKDLREMAEVEVHLEEARYREPLAEGARLMARKHPDADAVLLGSVASGKYVDVLLDVFGPRLKFPRQFGGLGDMSRGGLMLRCVREGRELDYVSVDGAFRGVTAAKARGQRRGPRGDASAGA